jgi:hypothetical protein
MIQLETLREVSQKDGNKQFEDPTGEYLDYVSSGNNTITVVTSVSSDKVGETGPRLPFSPSDQTINELESRLKENEYTQKELSALLASEKEGKDRKGAKQAIEERQ